MTLGTRMLITGLGVMVPGARTPAEALDPAVPPEPSWFTLAEALPGRGYKRLPPGAQYLLAAARAALADAGDCLAGVDPEWRGAVVGTNNVCLPVLDSMDRTIMDEGAAALSPAVAPFMAMSSFASRLSVEHGLRAFNLTANSPAIAGLEALAIGRRALAVGRARVLLAGAVEDVPVNGRPRRDADVGAVVLVCEPEGAAVARGARSHGTCRVHSAFVGPLDTSVIPEVLDGLWAAAMGDGPGFDRVDSVLDDSKVGAAVADWLDDRLPPGHRGGVPVPADAGCLTPLRRVAGLLTVPAGGAAPGPGRHVLVTASAQGNVALAVVTPSMETDRSPRGATQ